MHRTLLLLLFATLLPPAAAQHPRENVTTAGLDVEFAAGWGGLVDRSKPLPLSFLVSNYSGDQIDGELFIVDPSTGDERSLGELFLSEAARRRLSSVQNLQDWIECFAEIRVGRKVLWRRELSLFGDHDFSQSETFALVLNDSGRALEPPTENDPTAASTPAANPRYNGFYGYQMRPLAEPSGWPVVYAQMKTWQVPEHSGPLMPVRAIIVPEGKRDADLNGAQWTAVAKWICQGGQMFLPAKSDALMESLLDASPLAAAAPSQEKTFTVRRMGIGRILLYEGELFADDSPANQQIAEAVALMAEPTGPLLADSAVPTNVRGGTADWNRLWIVGFCVSYGLLSGIVVLVLARQPKRRVLIYTASIVSIASVASVVLGGALRFSRGDLQWISFTQAGAGGSVQTARVVIQSGGALNTRLSMEGNEVDLQSTGPAEDRYNWRPQPTVVRAFTQQKSLSDKDSTFRLNVPMTPWGREQLHAVAIQPDWKAPEIHLEWKHAGPPGHTFSLSGELVADIHNRLPVSLRSPKILITVAGLAPEQTDEDTNAESAPQPWKAPPQITVPLYFALPNLAPLNTDQSTTQRIPVTFRSVNQEYDLLHNMADTQFMLPRTFRQNSVSCWLIGVLPTSPTLQFDPLGSDFTELSATHLLIQRIEPQHAPDVNEFLGEPEQR